jgi:hypothetical protein
MPMKMKTTTATGKSKAASEPKSAKAAGVSTREIYSIVGSPQKTAKQRIAALAQTPLTMNDNDKNLHAVLDVLGDVSEPVEVRLAAMKAIQAASFSVVAFESSRSDYLVTLRKVAQDANADLRQRALGILAQEKDRFAQKKLLDGLETPEKALVPPEKALQLLGYDLHAAAFKAARATVENPPNPIAKQEGLRLLAGDATAAPLFQKILLDKNETRENRQISASALHSINPARMQTLARDIVVDPTDYADIRATSLTALAQFGDSAKVAADLTLRESVDAIKTQGPGPLQQSAAMFMNKYGK